MFVIAHRGANKLAPQNTIHAFMKAAELKSDGVETDVHVTKDGELVLCHNGTVGRIVKYQLNDTGAVTQVDKDQLALVSLFIGKTADNNLVSGVCR